MRLLTAGVSWGRFASGGRDAAGVLCFTHEAPADALGPLAGGRAGLAGAPSLRAYPRLTAPSTGEAGTGATGGSPQTVAEPRQLQTGRSAPLE